MHGQVTLTLYSCSDGGVRALLWVPAISPMHQHPDIIGLTARIFKHAMHAYTRSTGRPQLLRGA